MEKYNGEKKFYEKMINRYCGLQYYCDNYNLDCFEIRHKCEYFAKKYEEMHKKSKKNENKK